MERKVRANLTGDVSFPIEDNLRLPGLVFTGMTVCAVVTKHSEFLTKDVSFPTRDMSFSTKDVTFPTKDVSVSETHAFLREIGHSVSD